MGMCKYCGKQAGFFRTVHTECIALDAERQKKIRSIEDQSRAQALQALDQGRLPSWPAPVPISINIIEGEAVIWIFSRVECLADRIKRSYTGSYGGPSFRVLPGVYMRAGAFRGEPITSVDRVSLGHGSLIVTSRHVCFSGSAKAFRIPFAKIASFLPFSDGIGIIKDSASALPQIFLTGDNFAFHLITRVSRLTMNATKQEWSNRSKDSRSPREYSTDPLNDPDFNDQLYINAVNTVIKNNRASASILQQHLRISNDLAIRLLEKLENENVIGEPDSNGIHPILKKDKDKDN